MLPRLRRPYRSGFPRIDSGALRNLARCFERSSADKPGFPEEWEYASLHTPDIDFDFKAGEAATGKYSSRDCSLYTVTHRLPAVRNLELQFPARRSAVARLTVNGQNAAWRLVEIQLDGLCFLFPFLLLPMRR